MHSIQSGERLDLFVVIASLWPITGTVLDARHHSHGGEVESFWTFSHFMIYSGIAALIMIFGFILYIGVQDDRSFFNGLPEGYELAVVGVVLIGLGATADMVWHTLFGFETAPLEAGSPSHLVLGIGALLTATAPLRRAWYTGITTSWRDQFPMLTSSAYLLTILSFLIYTIHPFVAPLLAARYQYSELMFAPLTGAAGMILYTMFMTAVFLHLFNKFEIVVGGFTYTLSLNGLLMTAPTGNFLFLPAALLTGVVVDVLSLTLRPTWKRHLFVRLYSFLNPVALSSLYITTVFLSGGTTWSVHEWSAFLVLPGVGGLLTSYAILPSGQL